MTSRILLALVAFAIAGTPFLAAGMTATHVLRYIDSADAMRACLDGLLKSDKREREREVPMRLDVEKATVDGTTLEVDRRANTLVVHGEAAALRRVARIVGRIDVESDRYHIKAAIVRYRGGIDGPGVLAKQLKGRVGPVAVFDSQTTDLRAIVEYLNKDPRFEVRARPFVLTAVGQHARIAVGSEDESLSLGVTANVAHEGEVALALEFSSESGGRVSEIATKVQIPDRATIALGGIVERQADGSNVELMLLLTPRFVAAGTANR